MCFGSAVYTAVLDKTENLPLLPHFNLRSTKYSSSENAELCWECEAENDKVQTTSNLDAVLDLNIPKYIV